jgi:hypothetical protein
MARQAVSGFRIPVVTVLPPTPSDGQEVKYRFLPTQTPATTIPLIWHLQWDAALGAWLPVGEQRPIMAFYQPGAAISMGQAIWGTYDANDPRLTIPLAGTYEVETGVAEAYYSSGGSPTAADHLSLTLNKASGQIDVSFETGAAIAPGGTGGMNVKGAYVLALNDTLRQTYYLTATSAQNIIMRGRYTQARVMRIG